MAKNKWIDILYEDEELIILNKPAKLLSVPDRFDAKKRNLYHLLQEKYPQIFIIHRLDFETSGAILFAKNETSLAHLSQQFEERKTTKTYLAIVDGRMFNEEGTIEKHIAPHPYSAGKMVVHQKGKNALTTYKVVQKYRNFTKVEISLFTGRTHQIRVHFQAIGHPLAIDPMYGSRSALFLSEIKKKNFRLGKEQEEQPLVSRNTLHAWKLGIQHPTKQEHILVEASLPKDLRALVNQLDKWAR